MPSIVYQIDKKTGAKYAYESTSYWDKEKQQPRSTRKYIGVRSYEKKIERHLVQMQTA